LDTAYIYVRLKYDTDQFAQGLPNISTVVRGKKVYNPVTATTAWSQNPALCVFDYLKDTKYGLSESASNVNTTALIAAQSLCDETVNLSPSGTQQRYVLDGVVDTANSRKDNIEAMLSSMGGKLIYSGGEYFIVGADYVTPTVTVDESVLVGGLSVKTKQSRRSLYNGVKGVYLAEEENYTLADYPSLTSSTYSTEDGDPIYLDMPLPFTTNNVRAQRIAKIALLQAANADNNSLQSGGTEV
jgi:predicted phage tail protein